jgi:hypothetical protein
MGRKKRQNERTRSRILRCKRGEEEEEEEEEEVDVQNREMARRGERELYVAAPQARPPSVPVSPCRSGPPLPAAAIRIGITIWRGRGGKIW